ncbi:MAG: hypothetical protein ACLTKB_04250 [Lawsonibacter sp.]
MAVRGLCGSENGVYREGGAHPGVGGRAGGHDPDRCHAGRPGRLAGPCRPVRLGLLQLEDGDGGPGGGGGLLPAGGGAAWSPSVRSGREQICAGPCGRGERLELRPDLPLEQLTAPVQEGVRIGTLRGAVGDEAAGEVPLVCGASVPRDLAEPRRGLLRRLLSWLEER